MAAGNSDGTAPKVGKPFEKGKSGNPSGRPKVAEEFKERCRKAVDEHVFAAWLNEVQCGGENWAKAAELLAAYAYGKPSQSIVGAEGGPLEVILRLVDDAG